MKCFPFFVPLEGKKGLIIGGGKHAEQKVEKMLPFGVDLYVIAPNISKEIERIEGIHLVRRKFQDTDLEFPPAFVIVAMDDEEEAHRISALCQERNIPVNVVDDAAYCTFIFPSLVSNGDLSIGICTGGASPAASVYFRQQIEQLVPEKMDEILEFMEAIRPRVKEQFPNEKERGMILWEILLKCIQEGKVDGY